VFRCFDYEFEDVVASIEDAAFYLPSPRYRSPLLSDLSESLSRNLLKLPWNPAYSFPRIEKSYDIFFAMIMFSYDLEILKRMPNWKNKVGYSICYIDELFVRSLSKYSEYIDVLSKFDCVVLNCSGTVQTLKEMHGINAMVVSSGIDALRFFPGIPPRSRGIDILSIGRRDEAVHNQFEKLKLQDDWLYLYDTAVMKGFIDHKDHRNNLAHTMTRSQFFVVNPAKFDQKDDSGEQEEIGFRYFEGAAAGNVMIGRIPKNDEYKNHFPWKESVVELPSDPEDVLDFMRDLKQDSERLERISFDNVKGSLCMHDFMYRWQDVLSGCGLESHPAMFKRKESLNNCLNKWANVRKISASST